MKECDFVYRSIDGSSYPIRFPDPSFVKAYDGEGNNIVTPRCEKCKCYKNQLIGKEYFTWLCPCCGGQ